MVGRFGGKVVIVTGSSNGIGRATAVLFAEEGAKVTITGRDDKALAETRKEMQAVGAKKDDIVAVQGDLIDEVIQKKIIDATIEQFGKIDILVNNAGGTAPSNTLANGFDQTMETYDYVMNLNTKVVLSLTKRALPHLIATKGEIVMVSSIAGLPFALPGLPYYSMSKAALEQLTKSLAVKYIADGVRVNSVKLVLTGSHYNQHCFVVR
ncbi:unnamed protein product [Haemonchus placei]|uniref:NAD(P)-binding protein n=1 Tax=Haemonchus placei TaxID=6290 RepID=A0A0N4X9Y0_HAEPC|nr:unnamed protein product [Haemonchus placei]